MFILVYNKQLFKENKKTQNIGNERRGRQVNLKNKEKENPGDASPAISNKITFSHRYYKLKFIQQTVKLVKVEGPVLLSSLSKDFLEYDTAYYDTEKNENAHYELKQGSYLILTFLDSYHNIIFTTIRSAKPGKEDYYRGKIGQLFKIIFTDAGKTK